MVTNCFSWTKLRSLLEIIYLNKEWVEKIGNVELRLLSTIQAWTILHIPQKRKKNRVINENGLTALSTDF